MEVNSLRKAGVPECRTMTDDFAQWLVSPKGNECLLLAKPGSSGAGK